MKGIKLGEAYLDLVEINFNHFNKRCEMVFTSDEKGCGGLMGDYNYCPNCGAKMDLE